MNVTALSGGAESGTSSFSGSNVSPCFPAFLPLLLYEWSLAWGAVCSLGIQGTVSAGCGWLTSLLCCSVRRGCGLWRRRWNSWTSLTRGSASRSSWSTPGTACWRSGTGSPSALRPTQTRSTSSCGGGNPPRRVCLSDRLFWLDDRVCVRILFLFYTTWHSHLMKKLLLSKSRWLAAYLQASVFFSWNNLFLWDQSWLGRMILLLYERNTVILDLLACPQNKDSEPGRDRNHL